MKTHDDFIAIANGLVDEIKSAARGAEIARHPDDTVMEKARAAGLFELMAPRRYGGSELDLDTFFEVGLILGQADGSHGWVMCFCIEHVWMFAQFPVSFQEQVFAKEPFAIAPAMLSPAGTATPVNGGYVLNGRWPWATGVVHADWVIAGAMLTPEAGRPVPVFFALPKEQVTVIDTWNMSGMCGTGSHDVEIDNVFVPADRALPIPDMVNARSEGSRDHPGAIYRTPMAPILSFAASLPVLGQAKRVVDEFSAQLRGRIDMVTFETQANNATRQVRLAEADLEVAAAEHLMRWVLADVMEHRMKADEARRVRWTTSVAHAVQMCQRAVNRLSEVAGASSQFLDNPIQRARRDINTAAMHMVFDLDERHRTHGRALLGLPSQSMWF